MYISCVFVYAFAIFAAFPSPIMEAAFGRLHKGAESNMGDGKAANIAKA